MVSFETIKSEVLKGNISTPCIIISANEIIKSLNNFLLVLNFKREEVFYPVKVNSQHDILHLLNNENIGFEVGAISEIEVLHDLNVPMQKIIYGNPVKSAESINKAFRLGVNVYCADSNTELKKISINAPNSKVYFRVSISNDGSEWELTRKFGCAFKELPQLYQSAKQLGLSPIGISFHLGWNNRCVKTWKNVFQLISDQLKKRENEGCNIELINIGGGFPAHKEDQKEQLVEIAKVIMPFINEWRRQGRVVLAEPGSYLLSNAGVMVVSIIECIIRNNKKWVYVDSGIFQGFYWILGGLQYSISTVFVDFEKDYEEVVVCGPTCDTHDVFSVNVSLPKSIKTGDFLLIYPAGAYIHSAQKYNGFSYPIQTMIE